MPDYTLNIFVKGSTEGEQSVRSFRDVLGNIGTIAAGGLLADAIRSIGGAVRDIGKDAFESVRDYEMLSRSITSLAAREIASGQEVMQVTAQRVTLTKKETEEIGKLQQAMPLLIAQRNNEAAQIAEHIKKHAELIKKKGVTVEAIKADAAALALEQERYRQLDGQIGQHQKTIDALAHKQGELVQVQKSVRIGQVDMAQAMQQAQGPAKELLNWITQLAIKSPFDEKTIASIIQTAMGYSMNSKMAKDLTKSLANMGAGTGRSTDQLKLLGLALGQVWAKGKLTGEEMRQLTNAGIGVDTIARALKINVGDVAKAMEDGKISAKELLPALIDLLNKDFPNAAEDMASSWAGLESTWEDIKQIGLRDFFSSTFAVIQPMAADFVGTLSSPEFRAAVRENGQRFGEFVSGVITSLKSVPGEVQKIMADIPRLGLGGAVSKALGLSGDQKEIVTEVGNFAQKIIEAVKTGGPGGIGGVGAQVAKALAAEWPAARAQLTIWGLRFWDWVTDVIPKAGEKLAGIGAEVAKALAAEWPPVRAQLTTWGLRAWDWITEDAVPHAGEKLADLSKSLIDWTKTEDFRTATKATGRAIADSILAGIEFDPQESPNWAKRFVQWLENSLNAIQKEVNALGARIGDDLTEGILESFNGEAFVKKFKEKLGRPLHLSDLIDPDVLFKDWTVWGSFDKSDIKPQMRLVGKNMGVELVGGMSEEMKKNSALLPWTIVRQNIVGGAQDEFLIQSPSKVMWDEVGVPLGEGTGGGMQQGIEDSVPEAFRVLRDLIDASGSEVYAAGYRLGRASTGGVIGGVQSQIGQAVHELVDPIVAALDAVSTDAGVRDSAFNLTGSIIEWIRVGIWGGYQTVLDALRDMLNAALTNVQGDLGAAALDLGAAVEAASREGSGPPRGAPQAAGNNVTVAGDTYEFNVADEGTARLLASLVDERRTARLNAWMGV